MRNLAALGYGLLIWLLGAALAQAACITHSNSTNIGGASAAFSIINGLASTGDPHVTFNLPPQSIRADGTPDGNTYASSAISNGGSAQTLPNHVRFALNVLLSGQLISWQVDSSQPLRCIACPDNVTMPFSAFGWTVNRSAETVGSQPANGRFNNGIQTWLNINFIPGGVESRVNMQFDFLNDRVYPAGQYTGEFYVVGR